MFSSAFSSSHNSRWSSRYNTTGFTRPRLYVNRTRSSAEKCCSNPFVFFMELILGRKL